MAAALISSSSLHRVPAGLVSRILLSSRGGRWQAARMAAGSGGPVDRVWVQAEGCDAKLSLLSQDGHLPLRHSGSLAAVFHLKPDCMVLNRVALRARGDGYSEFPLKRYRFPASSAEKPLMLRGCHE
ncbi:hypothetical protein WJX72_000291 [[Myrmecia] bisecta]|uniref:Uncharacterized protein n=1 Tax=[Myrmecia] bisecta TaxID=41462 RepID=A0AAW1Q6B2_9CHLO